MLELNRDSRHRLIQSLYFAEKKARLPMWTTIFQSSLCVASKSSFLGFLIIILKKVCTFPCWSKEAMSSSYFSLFLSGPGFSESLFILQKKFSEWLHWGEKESEGGKQGCVVWQIHREQIIMKMKSSSKGQGFCTQKASSDDQGEIC